MYYCNTRVRFELKNRKFRNRIFSVKSISHFRTRTRGGREYHNNTIATVESRRPAATDAETIRRRDIIIIILLLYSDVSTATTTRVIKKSGRGVVRKRSYDAHVWQTTVASVGVAFLASHVTVVVMTQYSNVTRVDGLSEAKPRPLLKTRL